MKQAGCIAVIMATMVLVSINVLAQEPEEAVNDLQIEDLAANDEEGVEDDYALQQLNFYQLNRLNINGDRTVLEEFPLFDGTQIENILSYRRLFGDFTSIYELQAVPGFDLEDLRRLTIFISVDGDRDMLKDFRERFRRGQPTVSLRPLLTLPKTKSYADTGSQRYLGGPLAMLLRYKYQYRHQLQYGITAEKDAGELSFQHWRKPLDFLSMHLVVRDMGRFAVLVLGDYTINMGQGMIHWQSQAFKKGSSVIPIKRQAGWLRPYQSAGENNFFRGAAMITRFSHYELLTFASRRRLTVNTAVDPFFGEVITSINTSGLHRTSGELAKKDRASVITLGGSAARRTTRGHITLNALAYKYSMPILRRQQPYNLYTIKGENWANASIDFAQTLKNYHVFGEVAIDWEKQGAALCGLISSLDRAVDLSFLVRLISPKFQSVAGNAFTESSLPSNEKGVYAGVSYRADQRWRIDGFADVFSYRWLRYRIDAPSGGMSYLLQITWKPVKSTESYLRYRVRMKPLNVDAEETEDDHLSFPEIGNVSNFRANLNQHISKQITFRSRAEFSSHSPSRSQSSSHGYLLYTEFIYKPPRRSYHFNFRFQYFGAKNFDTRIYAYENNGYLNSSVPFFSGSGVRLFAVARKKIVLKSLINKAIIVSVKLAETRYMDGKTPVSAGEMLKSNRKADYQVQFFLTSFS